MPFDLIKKFLAENAVKFVPQEAMDDMIDKLIAEVCEGLQSLGLDPLPIPDIKIPYNLDKVTEAVVPLVGDESSPLRQILVMVTQLCKGCSQKVAGELRLKEGMLQGLSKLSRQGPVKLTFEEEGSVRLGAKFGVTDLTAPFQSEANLETMTINPDIQAHVDNVGLDLDVQLPVTGGDVQSNFDMNVGKVDVDLEGLGPLGDLAEYVAPYVADIVGKKLKEVLQTQVKSKMLEEVEKRLPGVTSLVTN